MGVVKFPVVIVNFKAYESALGERAVALTAALQEAVVSCGAALMGEVAVAVSALDIASVASKVPAMPVFAQHIDSVACGAKTGSVPPRAARAAGAQGTLLNHAEKKLPSDVLAASVALARDEGLFIVVCAESLERVQEVALLQPDAIAYEPPELIGGSVSVSTAQPEVIKRAVELAGAVPLLVGAGVKTRDDVRIGRELGAQGVLLASGIVLAPDPKAVLCELIQGL